MKKLEQTITTLDIAEMMEVSHNDILRKIDGRQDRKGYAQILSESQMALSDYFKESIYKDGSGKENKCYNVTKLGCDFLANKFTGAKGILFTARYVKRFHDLQEQILNPLDGLSTELQAIFLHDKKIQVVENRVDHLENTMNIDYAQQKQLRDFVNKIVKNALGGAASSAYKYRYEDGSKLSAQVFSRIWHDFYDYFNINAYANLPRVKFNEALAYINKWQPSTNMQLEIGRINREVA